MINKKKKQICPDCGCDFKTKYMIRVDFDRSQEFDFEETVEKDSSQQTLSKTNNESLPKAFFEATSNKSVVGWIKHILDSGAYGNFEDITITDLNKCCSSHVKRNKKIEVFKDNLEVTE